MQSRDGGCDAYEHHSPWATAIVVGPTFACPSNHARYCLRVVVLVGVTNPRPGHSLMTLPFDTFADVDYTTYDCVEAMVGHVFGRMTNQNYVSVILSGPMSPFWPNCKSNWAPGIGTEGDATTYYIRSWPKNRIAKPLEPGEVRMTSVYVSEISSSIVKMVIIVSYLVGHVDIAAYTNVSLRESYSVDGIPLMAPLSYGDQTAPYDRSGVSCRNGMGHKMILPSTVQVMHDNHTKSFRTGNHDYAVAGIIAGVPSVDRVRRSFEVTSEVAYDQVQISLISQLATHIAMKRPELPSAIVDKCPNPTAAAAFVLNSARVACDMLSAAGLVDIIASPIADGALPDAMQHPLCLPLVLALLTRIAAKPGQFQLKPGTMNDIYAAQELAELFESQYNPILRAASPVLPAGESLWAIDVCATVAMRQVKMQVKRIKKKKEKHIEETCMEEALNALFSLGVGLCNDVMGAAVPESVYTEFGLAEKIVGPIELARAKASAAKGMGKLGSSMSSVRVSSRAARQRALVQIVCDVEDFLRTGRCGKIHLAGNSSSAGPSAPPEQDADGFPTVPSLDSSDVEAALEQATSRDAFFQAREQIQNVLSRGPMVLNSFTLSTYVASRFSKLECVTCGSEVDVFGGVVFAQSSSECSVCAGKRCWQCSAQMDMHHLMDSCRRCNAGTPTQPASS